MAVVAKSPTIAENMGQFGPFCFGVTLMAAGTATVQLASKFSQVFGGVPAIVNAATGVGEFVTLSFSGVGNTTMVIETMSEAGALTGTSLVGWIVYGIPKA